jgi:hypothetical protein
MPDLAEVWNSTLPDIRRGVTGVGVWTALNTCKPIAFEEGVLVLGLRHADYELSGHLRLPHTKTLVEQLMTEALGSKVELRVIEGDSYRDWESTKRKDVESQRLRTQALHRERAELHARSTWEDAYEELHKIYSSVGNRSWPQNRAKFYQQALQVLAEARREHPDTDDLNERNFARCLERTAQYADVPSALVALEVMKLLA